MQHHAPLVDDSPKTSSAQRGQSDINARPCEEGARGQEKESKMTVEEFGNVDSTALDARLGDVELRVSMQALIKQLVHEQARAGLHLQELQNDVTSLLQFRERFQSDVIPSGDVIPIAAGPPVTAAGNGLACLSSPDRQLQRSASGGTYATSGIGTSTSSTGGATGAGDSSAAVAQRGNSETDELLQLLETIEAHGRRLQKLNFRILSRDGSGDAATSDAALSDRINQNSGASTNDENRQHSKDDTKPGSVCRFCGCECRQQGLSTPSLCRTPNVPKSVVPDPRTRPQSLRLPNKPCPQCGVVRDQKNARTPNREAPERSRASGRIGEQQPLPMKMGGWDPERHRSSDEAVTRFPGYEMPLLAASDIPEVYRGNARELHSLPVLHPAAEYRDAGLFLTHRLLNEREALWNQLHDLRRVASQSQLHVESLQSRLHEALTDGDRKPHDNHDNEKPSTVDLLRTHRAASSRARFDISSEHHVKLQGDGRSRRTRDVCSTSESSRGDCVAERGVRAAPSLPLPSRIPQLVSLRRQNMAQPNALGRAARQKEVVGKSRETQTLSMAPSLRRISVNRSRSSFSDECSESMTLTNPNKTASVGVNTSAELAVSRSVGTCTSISEIDPGSVRASNPGIGQDVSIPNENEEHSSVRTKYIEAVDTDATKDADISVKFSGISRSAQPVPDRASVSSILREMSPVALQRRLLVQLVEAEVLRSQVSSLGSRLAARESTSRISSDKRSSDAEKEELRLQLEVRNIELEGTRARLRQLESKLEGLLAGKEVFENGLQEDVFLKSVDVAESSEAGFEPRALDKSGSEATKECAEPHAEEDTSNGIPATVLEKPCRLSGVYERPILTIEARNHVPSIPPSEPRPGTPSISSGFYGGRNSPRRPASRSSITASHRPNSRSKFHGGARTPTGVKTPTGSRTPTRAGTPTSRPSLEGANSAKHSSNTSTTQRTARTSGRLSVKNPEDSSHGDRYLRATGNPVRAAGGSLARRSTIPAGAKLDLTEPNFRGTETLADSKEKIRRRVSLTSDPSNKISPTQSHALGQILTALTRGHSPRSSARRVDDASGIQRQPTETLVQAAHHATSKTAELHPAIVSTTNPTILKTEPARKAKDIEAKTPAEVRWIREQAAARLRQARLETSDGEVADSLTSATASEDGATYSSWEDKLKFLTRPKDDSSNATLRLTPGEGLIQRILSGKATAGHRVKPKVSE